MDPRVHCALVCGAKSCPPIRVYSAVTLDSGLEAAAEAFCEVLRPAAPPRACRGGWLRQDNTQC